MFKVPDLPSWLKTDDRYKRDRRTVKKSGRLNHNRTMPLHNLPVSSDNRASHTCKFLIINLVCAG